jgi:hypothetical protein
MRIRRAARWRAARIGSVPRFQESDPPLIAARISTPPPSSATRRTTASGPLAPVKNENADRACSSTNSRFGPFIARQPAPQPMTVQANSLLTRPVLLSPVPNADEAETSDQPFEGD